MLTSLALFSVLTASAATTEVGHGKNFGIGVQMGSPVTVTGKYWMDDQGGVAFHAGTWFGFYNEGRVQYERQFVQFGDWDFADLGMYWHAGVFARLWTLTGYESLFSLGPSGGVAGEMRFKEVPAAVFLEAGSAVMVLGHDHSWLSLNYAAGGRWYF
jgi:hypothetical protein